MQKKKEESIRQGDFAEASLLQKEQEEVQRKLNDVRENGSKRKRRRHSFSVTEDDIAEVVSAWTKIPVQKLAESDADRLRKLENVLKKESGRTG